MALTTTLRYSSDIIRPSRYGIVGHRLIRVFSRASQGVCCYSGEDPSGFEGFFPKVEGQDWDLDKRGFLHPEGRRRLI